MVPDNSSLSAKRAIAADLERRVGRKFSRTKSKTGAVVSGSEFDPRKGGGVQGMRTRDVEAHIRKLERTLSRSTQFVAGARGAPLPRAKFSDYEKSAIAVQEQHENMVNRFGGERLPGPGTETVAQRQDKIRTKHPTAMNKGYVPPVLKPFNIKDAEALVKLTKSNKKRMTKKWAKEEHKRAQDELRQMVEVFRNDKLTKSVEGLTFGQFDMLWNLTRFADALSLGYHHIKKKYTPKQEIPESVLNDQIEEANSLIDWVKKFDV